jgi:uncharacterized protein YecA (UPF0149 family)
MFEIQRESVAYLFRARVHMDFVTDDHQTNLSRAMEKFVQMTNNEEKIGRNDPCPCGSGKKYKKCCGK